MTPETPRRRPLGVRSRTALSAVVVVAVVLAAGILAFAVLARSRVEESIRSAAGARLDGLVALIEAGAFDGTLPGSDPELLAQVVDGTGEVLAADPAVAGLPPLYPVSLAPGERTELRAGELLEADDGADDLVDDDPYLIVAAGVAVSPSGGTVLVAASLEDAAEAVGATVPLLVFGLPAVLVIVAVVTWLLTGRALAPVEAMRRRAAGISGSGPQLRLPLPRTGDEVARLAVTLNEMLDRLAASSLRQRRFVADASHELKSPLAVLRAMLDVAGADPAVARDPEFVDDLRAEVDRMQELVSDLLYLAELDDSSPTTVEPVDLAAVVRAEVDPASRLRPDVAIDIDGVAPALVAGDAAALSRLVRNLTANAVRHAASRVWLDTGVVGAEVRLTVSDDGGGIALEHRALIFGRFVRLDPGRGREAGGTGLGLAIVRAVARSHGGDVRVTDPRHGGATFEATFPAYRPS